MNSSDAVFRAFASQNQNISLAVSKLPATLQQTSATLTKVDRFGRILGPALESLRAPFRQLNVANHAVLPFVKEAEPIVRTKIRPFVQVARPNIRNLRPAAIDLAKATPDLVASFHELNRFFNMAAYNPKGREPVTGNDAQDKKRDEGYLFWLAWVSQNTTSLFNTSDAQGPLRRFVIFFTCTTIREQLAAKPAAGPLLGLTNALNDPGLCPSGEGGTGGGGLPLPKQGWQAGLTNRRASQERWARWWRPRFSVMQKGRPSFLRILAMVVFALSCFGLLTFMWISFGGAVPLKSKQYQLTVNFPEATTLAEAADVRIAGVTVGKVGSKQLDKGANRTKVVLKIDPKFAPLPRDTRAILRQKTLLGETFVELSPGSARRAGWRTAARSRTRRSSRRSSSTRSCGSSTRPRRRRSGAGCRSPPRRSRARRPRT